MFQSGWGSQWFKSNFTVKMGFEDGGEEGEVMLLFKHAEKAREILEVADDKALGREIKDFDEDTWVSARKKIVLDARTKGSRPSYLRQVEANLRDRIWAIGYGAKNALRNRG